VSAAPARTITEADLGDDAVLDEHGQARAEGPQGGDREQRDDREVARQRGEQRGDEGQLSSGEQELGAGHRQMRVAGAGQGAADVDPADRVAQRCQQGHRRTCGVQSVEALPDAEDRQDAEEADAQTGDPAPGGTVLGEGDQGQGHAPQG
jgi:hypothetical protein